MCVTEEGRKRLHRERHRGKKRGEREKSKKGMGMARKRSAQRWNSSSLSQSVGDCGIQPPFALYDHTKQAAGAKPDRIALVSMLRACHRSENAAVMGPWIHDQVMRISPDAALDASLGNALIGAYANRGLVDDAMAVFGSMLPQHRDVVSWGAIMGANLRCGRFLAVLALYEKMRNQGLWENHVIFLAVIKACSSSDDIDRARTIHAQIVHRAFDEPSSMAVGNALVHMYCRCGSLEEAYKLFFRLETRDVITYSTLVGALVDHPHHHRLHPHPHQACLELVWEMLGNGVRPNRYVYLCAIKACARAEDASGGRYVNAAVFEDGWDRDVFVRSYLVGLYARCGALDDARAIFDMLPARDVVLWGSMMEEYVKQGQHLGALELYEKMQRSDVEPNKVVFLSLLKACGAGHSSQEGECIHGQIVRNEWERDVMIGSSLVDMYAKCGRLAEACNVFGRLPEKNAVTWASMIAGHVQHGSAAAAIELFDEMIKERVKPDEVVFLGLLKACGDVGDAARCRRIHASIVGAEFEGDRDVNDALIDAYARCGSRDEAMALLRKVHGQIVGDGLESDVGTGNALVDVHAKQGSVDEARNRERLLDDKYVASTPDRRAAKMLMQRARGASEGAAPDDSAAYGDLIAGYAAHEQASAALELFQKMKERGELLPSKATLLRIVRACSDVGAAGQGRLVHADIVKIGLDADATIANAVLEMHATCVGAREAHQTMLLGSMPGRDVVSWSVLVSAYARSGEPDSVARCLREMQAERLLPDRVVFTTVLTACAQAGLLEDGCRYFASMPAGGASPFADHYNCLVDLLSRAGRLSDAHGLLATMPVHPDVVSWRCLLNACQRCCANAGLGRRCMAEIAKFADHLDADELFEEGILNFDDDDDSDDDDDDDDDDRDDDDDDGGGGGGGDAHSIAVF